MVYPRAPHAAVWIIWQQVFAFGNNWPKSTISIESRNARIKKFGRSFTNWRPLVDGHTAYSYVDRRSGKHVEGERRYNSSAVGQLLSRIALSEIGWHTSHKFVEPTKLRLITQLRSSALKVEVADAPPRAQTATMLVELTSKL